MAILSALTALLGSSAGGSIIGGLFAIFNRKADIEARRVDLAHERAKWAHDVALRDKDIALANAEAQGRKDVAIIEGDSAIETARMGAIGEANKSDAVTAEELQAAGKWRWALVLASAYRKSMRSILTTAIGGAAIYVNVALCMYFMAIWPDMSPQQRYELSLMALSWISAQGSAVVTFWFVARGNAEGRAK